MSPRTLSGALLQPTSFSRLTMLDVIRSAELSGPTLAILQQRNVVQVCDFSAQDIYYVEQLARVSVSSISFSIRASPLSYRSRDGMQLWTLILFICRRNAEQQLSRNFCLAMDMCSAELRASIISGKDPCWSVAELVLFYPILAQHASSPSLQSVSRLAPPRWAAECGQKRASRWATLSYAPIE